MPKPEPHPVGNAAPRVYFRDRPALRQWLTYHHDRSGPIWLVYDKVSSTTSKANRALVYNDIVEEALCFGWIDSVAKSLSAEQAMLYFSPRKPKSVWSAANKRRVQKLTDLGLITAAGQQLVDAAKADGSWTALDQAESLVVPSDLDSALRRNTKARRHFEAFPPGARKVILTWITLAKRPEARDTRIRETVRLAARNIRACTPEARAASPPLPRQRRPGL